MTDRDALMALADRVEALAGPDREVDALIWCALHGKKYKGHHKAYGSNETQVEFTEPPKRVRRVTGAYSVPHAANWTGSLDAAVMLAPEGLEWTAGRTHDDKGIASIWLADSTEICAEAATPALAICAASLRALAGERG